MKGWKPIAIRELIADGILEIGDGYRAKNSELDSTGLPFARAGNINHGFQFDDADLLSLKSAHKARAKVSHVNDCVITTKGTFGRVEYVKSNTRQFVYSPQLCYWRSRDNQELNPRFLFYWLQGPDFLTQAYKIKSSTDMADYANLTDQRAMDIHLPPLKIQQKIAAVLSAYDDLIENNNRRIAILEKMAEELYREWFVRLRFPGHEKVKIVKGVPEGWVVKRIAEVVDFLSGYSFKSETYLPSGKHGIVTIKNVQDGFFMPECSDFINVYPSNMKDHCLLKDGDVLMSLTGNVGRICHVIGENYLLNQRVAMLRPKINNASQFIYNTFKNRSMVQLIENLSLGSTAQMNLSPIQLGKQKIITPNENILEKYESITVPMRSEIISILRRNVLLKISRNRLLTRLMSGKIDVEDLDIQFPANMKEEEVVAHV